MTHVMLLKNRYEFKYSKETIVLDSIAHANTIKKMISSYVFWSILTGAPLRGRHCPTTNIISSSDACLLAGRKYVCIVGWQGLLCNRWMMTVCGVLWGVRWGSNRLARATLAYSHFVTSINLLLWCIVYIANVLCLSWLISAAIVQVQSVCSLWIRVPFWRQWIYGRCTCGNGCENILKRLLECTSGTLAAGRYDRCTAN